MATGVEGFRGPVIVRYHFAAATINTIRYVTKRNTRSGEREWATGGGYTNNSSGKVVKQLNPKQNLARFTIPLSLGKLFNIFPIVLSLKTRTPARAMIRHAKRDNPVLKWVTVLKRSIVGFLRAP